MHFSLTMIVGSMGGRAALLAVVFGLRASLVRVPDDIDCFISVQQWASRPNLYGAKAASIAPSCGLLVLWLGRQAAQHP